MTLLTHHNCLAYSYLVLCLHVYYYRSKTFITVDLQW